MSLKYYARGPKCCTASKGEHPGDDAELSGSVGAGGQNLANDVKTVQSKLNAVSTEDGGPATPLDVDGLCGPKTKAAILHFQRSYPTELISDGRIDRDKNTWKKLVATADGGNGPAPREGTPVGPPSPSAVVDDTTQRLFASYLWYTRHRIFETIKAIDESIEDLKLCRAYVNIHPELSLFRSYRHWEVKLGELPTFDRCFHVVSETMNYTQAESTLNKVRRVYVHMLDVIVANSITTPEAEKTHSREFLRVVEQKILDWAHGTGKAMADAPLGGWWFKNANQGRIRYGSGYLNNADAFTTLIHEMAHFVSHASTFQINHEGGTYNAAFKASPHQAVRNAFCYEWYALLACFKYLRSDSNDALTLT